MLVIYSHFHLFFLAGKGQLTSKDTVYNLGLEKKYSQKRILNTKVYIIKCRTVLKRNQCNIFANIAQIPSAVPQQGGESVSNRSCAQPPGGLPLGSGRRGHEDTAAEDPGAGPAQQNRHGRANEEFV